MSKRKPKRLDAAQSLKFWARVLKAGAALPKDAPAPGTAFPSTHYTVVPVLAIGLHTLAIKLERVANGEPWRVVFGARKSRSPGRPNEFAEKARRYYALIDSGIAPAIAAAKAGTTLATIKRHGAKYRHLTGRK